MKPADEPQPGALPWRVGRKVGRTVYDAADRLIGVMDTPELAQKVVESVNGGLYVNKRVIWRHRPRGRGFVLRLPAKIVKLTAKRATVIVEGTGARRVVSLASVLKPERAEP